MDPHLLRARQCVVQQRIALKAARDRARYSTQDAQSLFDNTVLRRAVVDGVTIDELKQVLHEITNLL